eukprot:2504144-Pyramimonas_sp.AAC.1
MIITGKVRKNEGILTRYNRRSRRRIRADCRSRQKQDRHEPTGSSFLLGVQCTDNRSDTFGIFPAHGIIKRSLPGRNARTRPKHSYTQNASQDQHRNHATKLHIPGF